jgi:hypothetical protein
VFLNDKTFTKNMKKIIYLILALCSFNLLKAQPCSDFNASLGNWSVTSAYSNLSNTNALDATNCVSFYNVTVPPNATLRNTIDFNNLGTMYLNSCLSFDYYVYEDGDGATGSVPIFPRIYITDGINIAWFQSSTSIYERTTWERVVAPIQLTSSPTSPLPSNSYGSWFKTSGMTNADFDNVMLNNTSIYFMSLSSSGFTQMGTQEDIRVDNVCVANCQSSPCETFDTPASPGNWVADFCTDVYTNINPLDGSNCATLTDDSGPSFYTNGVDYNDLGTNHLNRCLCFDYNITNDGISGSSPAIFPTIYLFLGSQWIAFQSRTSITEGSTWVHLCANIELTTSTALTLPENADGTWIMAPGMTWTDFNNVLLNNTSIGFVVDVAGSTAQTEDIRVDNICVVDCPSPCNANFAFNFVINSDPAALNNYLGSIAITTLNIASTYQIDWGDGAITTLPPPHVAALQHIYLPGSYVVCVTEKMADGTVCTRCIRICVPERLPDVTHGGGTTPGGPTSLQKPNNNKNVIEPTSKEIQTKLKSETINQLNIYPNPASNSTKIDFKIESANKVSIKVIDLLGNVVLTIPGEQYAAGNHTTTVNTKGLSSGIYSIIVTVGDKEISEKLSILK